MSKSRLTVIVAALSCLVASRVGAAQSSLLGADWSVKSSHSLASRPPSNEDVLALVQHLVSLDDLRLCSFRFADLRHTGNLSLIVSTEQGRFCNVQIVDRTASGFEIFNVDSSRDSSIALKGIDGGVRNELIVEVDLTSYMGAQHCVATWPIVYAWTGNGYSDVSSRNKQFYEHRLELLKKRIIAFSSVQEQAWAVALDGTSATQSTSVVHQKVANLGATVGRGNLDVTSISEEGSSARGATSAAVPDERATECIKAEAAKIERFLGNSPNAGLSDAIQWANSDDPWTRNFASAILVDVGTPEAMVYLETLSNDPDQMVAHFSKEALKSIGQGRTVHKIEREDVIQPLAEPLTK